MCPNQHSAPMHFGDSHMIDIHTRIIVVASLMEIARGYMCRLQGAVLPDLRAFKNQDLTK